MASSRPRSARGPTSPAWNAWVMQVGNPGDPALAVLKGATEGADLIMSEQLKKDVVGKINEPAVNVKAGIAYLVTRLAKSEFQSVLDSVDTKTFDYIVVAGDSLDKIAQKVGSTVDVLKKLQR